MLRTSASTSRSTLVAVTRWMSTGQRHSLIGATSRTARARDTRQSPQPFKNPPGLPFARRASERPSTPTLPKSEEQVIPYFEGQVLPWSLKESTVDRLELYGLHRKHIPKLLSLFAEAVRSGALSGPRDFQFYQLQRFAQPREDREHPSMVFSTIFFWWAARPETRTLLLEKGIDSESLEIIKKLVKATNNSYPADQYPQARSKHRKIIMHVGPTNSGKTHHALRALAAASSGVYAGPLRLLAHEIWERLNTGQIVPLGAELPKSTNGKPALSGSLTGDPRYRRLCNMITGEEQKIMGEHVDLLSCTIEMLSFNRFQEVAVVDEIQMIADENRGNGWVNAVLGLDAKELHLCGEETAVPIVQKLLKHTGDEIVVNRYERLTPLRVEDESLGGDLSKVQKGDCIVTFSRANIFKLKKLVEEQTGMRCAVVYGRLPPEVRSEQAALFNDPNSGYDVLVGSDAIGMGLNLKIKRIIFEAVSKMERGKHRPLAVSSVKQIAGRAGRFGLHGSASDSGGGATTLWEEDLPYLRQCVQQPYLPLPYATINLRQEEFQNIESALPPDSSVRVVLEAPSYIGRYPPGVMYSSTSDRDDVAQFIDTHWSSMSIHDKVLLLNAPVPWRDADTCELIRKMLWTHERQMEVSLEKVLRGQEFLDALKITEAGMMQDRGSPRNLQASLRLLESFHKVIVFYLWMSSRHPVVYSEYNDATLLKERVEKVLNWCLEKLSSKVAQDLGQKSGSAVRASAGLKYMTSKFAFKEAQASKQAARA